MAYTSCHGPARGEVRNELRGHVEARMGRARTQYSLRYLASLWELQLQASKATDCCDSMVGSFRSLS